ncbi:MAG: GAF domain-containing protein, partial [bacterium]
MELLEAEARLATARTGLYVRGLDTLMSGLEGLHGFEAASAHVKSQAELAQLIIQAATRLLRTGIGSIMLLDRDHQDLRIVASQGLPQDVVASTRLKVGEGIAGRVMQDGEPIFVADIEKDLRFTRAANVRYNSRSFICVPMRVKERILGVMNIN